MSESPASSGELDLAVLIGSMTAVRRLGEFVFVSISEEQLGTAELSAEATIREAEGVTLVLNKAGADDAGLEYDYVAAWITLTVHSSLAAVGLTAAVSRALADAGISCNVLAGYFHDHLLVPADRADDALSTLETLSTQGG